MKVINLGEVRELRADWKRVDDAIRATRVRAFNLTLLDDEGNEIVFLGGTYKTNLHEAVKALLRLSAARTVTDGDSPSLRVLGG